MKPEMVRLRFSPKKMVKKIHKFTLQTRYEKAKKSIGNYNAIGLHGEV